MSYQPKVYREHGGDILNVAEDGKILVKAGGRLHVNRAVSNVTTAGAGTYTAAHIEGGLITRDCAGGARTLPDTDLTHLQQVAAPTCAWQRRLSLCSR